MTCRICLENDGTTIRGVCDCSGSMAFVHKECILRWMVESKKTTCEICHARFRIQPEMEDTNQDTIAAVSCCVLSTSSILMTNMFMLWFPKSTMFLPAVCFIYQVLAAVFIWVKSNISPFIIYSLTQLVYGCQFITSLMLVWDNSNTLNGLCMQCGLFVFAPVVWYISKLLKAV